MEDRVSEEEDFKEDLKGCGYLLVLAPLEAAVRWFLLYMFWGWFVTPLGVPSIGVWHAGGLLLVANIFSSGTAKAVSSMEKVEKELEESSTQKSRNKLLIRTHIKRLISYLILLGLGAGIHWMMT